MTNLEKGKEYFIKFKNGKELKFHISGGPIQYFLSFTFYSNDTLFKSFRIDKQAFTIQTLGYYDEGDWPYCISIDDVNKLLSALLKLIEDKGCKFTCNFEFFNEINFWDY